MPENLERTYRNLQRLSVFLVTLGVFLLASVLGLALYENHQRGIVAERACLELEKVRTYARDSAERAKDSLPTIAYYRQHPAELAKALANIDSQIHSFSPPLNCEEFR